MKVVPPTENLTVIAIRDHGFCDVIYFLWFLRLASSLRENNVTLDVEVGLVADIAFDSDEAGLFGMLQIESVTSADLPVDGLLHPGDFLDDLVAPFVEELECKAEFVVDHPDEQKTICLDLVYG